MLKIIKSLFVSMFLIFSFSAMAESKLDIQEEGVSIKKYLDRLSEANGYDLIWNTPYDFKLYQEDVIFLNSLEKNKDFKETLNIFFRYISEMKSLEEYGYLVPGDVIYNATIYGGNHKFVVETFY